MVGSVWYGQVGMIGMVWSRQKSRNVNARQTDKQMNDAKKKENCRWICVWGEMRGVGMPMRMDWVQEYM